jgi:hypothetical protein
VADTIEHAGDGETTRIDTERRVKRTEELLCSQYTSSQIVRTLCEEFGVVDRTAYAYLKVAYERIAADGSVEDRALRKARARASWQRQYQRCLDREDMPAANYALDRLCRLDGLFDPQKHSVSINATLNVQVQIRSIVALLDAKGLAALDEIVKQIEVAQAKGLLPAGEPRDPIGDAIDAELESPPAPKRGKKSKAKP